MNSEISNRKINLGEIIDELLQKEGQRAIVNLVMECFGLSNESDVTPEGLYEAKGAYCLVVKSLYQRDFANDLYIRNLYDNNRQNTK